jgi:hypothetical protein
MALLASHPDNRGQAMFLADHNLPASHANDAYCGIHTFKCIIAIARPRWCGGASSRKIEKSLFPMPN